MAPVFCICSQNLSVGFFVWEFYYCYLGFFFSGPPLNKAKLYKHQNRDQADLPNGARHSDYERIPSWERSSGGRPPSCPPPPLPPEIAEQPLHQCLSSDLVCDMFQCCLHFIGDWVYLMHSKCISVQNIVHFNSLILMYKIWCKVDVIYA